MLKASHLTKFFSGVAAVKDVSFEVHPGEVLGYLGPNGSGKTTTVNMVLGLLEPSHGTVLFRGRDIRDDLVGYRRRVGYVPEEASVYPYLSGREYLELVGRLRTLPTPLLARKVRATRRHAGARQCRRHTSPQSRWQGKSSTRGSRP